MAKINNVCISQTNDKLGSQIPSVSLLPSCSCRKDAPCSHLCYAQKGHFRYNQAQTSQLNNYNIYINDKNAYFNAIIKFLSGLVSYRFFRWHVAGDIVDMDYLLGMIQVAKKCKNTKFLAFTKKYELVNEFIANGGKIPSNLKIIFSAWFKGWNVPNPYNLPVAYVFFKNKNLNPEIPDTSIPCKGACYECQGCWSLKKGQSVYFDQH